MVTTGRDSPSAQWPGLVRYRGQLLDALVLVANLLLQEPFARLLQPAPEVATNGSAADRLIGAILLAALVAYTLGAFCKRLPLHARVPDLQGPTEAGCLFVGWLCLHFVVTSVAAAFVAAAFTGLPEALLVTVMVLGCTLPTWFAVRVGFRPRRLLAAPAWRKSPVTEWVADLLIALAVIPSTLVWNVFAAELLATWTGPTLTGRLVPAALAAGGFAMLYVTPRVLFLIEDHARWTTWLTILSTPLPLLGRMLIG